MDLQKNKIKSKLRDQRLTVELFDVSLQWFCRSTFRSTKSRVIFICRLLLVVTNKIKIFYSLIIENERSEETPLFESRAVVVRVL